MTTISATDVPGAEALDAATGVSIKASVAVRVYKQGSGAQAADSSRARGQKRELVQRRATVAPEHRAPTPALRVTIDPGHRKITRAHAGGYRAPATRSAQISEQGPKLRIASFAYSSPSWYRPATVAQRTADSYELAVAPAPSNTIPVVLTTLTLG